MTNTADSEPSNLETPTDKVVTLSDEQRVEGQNAVAPADITEGAVELELTRSATTRTAEDDCGGNDDKVEIENGMIRASSLDIKAPPLPAEQTPPLPEEEPPAIPENDDGWAPIWEETAQAFYFYNRFTGATQWTNPRVPDQPRPGPPGIESSITSSSQAEEPSVAARPAGGYDPAVHGDYDPDAWYAQPSAPEEPTRPPIDPSAMYTATGAFNRFTGRWQAAELAPEKFNDENKSSRQMNAFFDVDAAANSHDGRSLKAERSGKKLSKSELKQFKEKRKAKKEEKRRAWLKD